MPPAASAFTLLADMLETIIADPQARAAAQAELARIEGAQAFDKLKVQHTAINAEARSNDPWTRRARPAFLYVMYALFLWSLPMGLLAAYRPEMASAISAAMTSYLEGLPEPLYALFGTGYLGYTAARQWGKARGTDR